MRRRDKVAGSRRSEGPTRDAWISPFPDARKNIRVEPSLPDEPVGTIWHRCSGGHGADEQTGQTCLKALEWKKGDPPGEHRGLQQWGGQKNLAAPDLKGRWSQLVYLCSVEKWSKCFLWLSSAQILS